MTRCACADCDRPLVDREGEESSPFCLLCLAHECPSVRAWAQAEEPRLQNMDGIAT